MVGFAEAPDNVGYPLAVPRFYISLAALDARFGASTRNPQVNVAEIWLRDPRYLNEVLVQARATSFGLRDLRFVTRSGVRVLLDQAAGIVIDLLVALSVIALATAGVMLAASARAEVQRRLKAIGVRRAVGASAARRLASSAVEAASVAVPAATLGVVVGVLATYGAERPAADDAQRAAARVGAGRAARGRLGGWPSRSRCWRRRGRHGAPPAARRWRCCAAPTLAAGAGSAAGALAARRGAGLAALGARLVGARRARLAATVLTLGLSTAFVLLMLALASALSALETDPARSASATS